MRDYGYSYEIYEPANQKMTRFEDHFLTRKDATRAMRQAMRDEPTGSSATVCKRYDDGETTENKDFIKREYVVRIQTGKRS